MINIENLVFGIISIAVAGGIFLAIRTTIKIKLKRLKGTQKMLGLITIGIIVAEGIYLGINFDLLRTATEVIASMGVAFGLVVWAFQNNLKNAVAGIGIYLNPEINVGDIIEIGDNKGVIVDLHLTKIIAIAEDGIELYIPAQKIDDEVTIIHHKQKEKTN